MLIEQIFELKNLGSLAVYVVQGRSILSFFEKFAVNNVLIVEKCPKTHFLKISAILIKKLLAEMRF